MASLTQAALFFAIVGAGYLLGAPYPSGAERFATLLGGAVAAAIGVYLVPWVYWEIEPRSDQRVRESGDE